jgi:hypothetical protein
MEAVAFVLRAALALSEALAALAALSEPPPDNAASKAHPASKKIEIHTIDSMAIRFTW